jgi:hypothetical protein
MVDVLFLATLVAFFALMVAFVHLCERIVGKDDAVDSGDAPEAIDSEHTEQPTPEEVPA